MSLPDKCPLCCAHVLVEWDGKQRKSDRSATFECQTSIYAGQAPRQTQSRWCEVRERQHLAARVAELEAREKQRAADEAWANERTVLVEFQPVTSGWYASASDGVVGINATAPTIHGALRALREKMEARP